MAIRRLADRSKRQRAARIDYPDNLAKRPVTRPFDAAIRALIPEPFSYANALALFAGRATKASLHAWRFGTRGAPAWAIELLRQRADERAKALQDLVAPLQPGPGMGWNKNATRGLGEWRAKRNLEKRD